MTKNEFLNEIREVLNIEKDINENDKINDLVEFDSLSIIALIAMYDSLFSVNVSYQKLQSCKFVKDLVDIIREKLE